MKGLVKGVHHIALRVSSEAKMKEAVDFYCDILDMKILSYWGKEKEAGCMIEGYGMILEMYANAEGDRTIGPIDHIAFDTDDVDKCVEVVKEAGLNITLEPTDIVLSEEKDPIRARIAFCIGKADETIEFYYEYK